MPDQPSWLERVPALEAALQAETAPPLLNRAAFESLFGVRRRRRAISLLHRCQGYRKGRELVAQRDSVLAFLAEVKAGGTFEELQEQKHRVAAFLGEARHGLTLPSIRIPEPARLSEITLAGLPPGIQLARSQLTVTFDGAEELVEKLFTLAQALANDYDSLEAALAGALGSEERHGSVEPDRAAEEDRSLTRLFDLHEERRLRAEIEAALFASPEPVSVPQLARALEESEELVLRLLEQLVAECERPERGLFVRQIGRRYTLASKPEHQEFLQDFLRGLRPRALLSLPALQTLAIIAYKQPISAQELQAIRRVAGAGVLTLHELP